VADELLSPSHKGQVRAALVTLLACGVGGVACAPLSRDPRTILDERTGASITVAREPLVLARERRDLAAQARDYLTIISAEVNIAGRRQLVLCVHEWSTIDVRARGTDPRQDAPLLLVADGRDLLLQPVAAPALDAITLDRDLRRPGAADVHTTFYAIDGESLRYLLGGQRIAAAFPQGQPPLPFGLWRDERAAQVRLLDSLGR
jgi:hypothetical protein